MDKGLHLTNDIHGGNTEGRDIRLDFSVNVNPAGPPDGVLKALRESVDDVRFYPALHSVKLLAAIKEDIRSKEGLIISEDCLLAGAGASELIMAAARLYAGKTVLMQSPCFSGYERAFRHCGCSISYCGATDALALAPDTAARIIKERPAVFVMCDPSNPSGYVTPCEELKSLAAACAAAGTVMLIDECFIAFVRNYREHSALRLFSDELKCIVLRAFTKLYAIPGVRLAYCVCSDKALAEAMAAQLPEWNISAPAYAAGLAALKETAYAQAAAVSAEEERGFMERELNALGFKTYPSGANYILFRSEHKLFDELLGRGILIRDCANYKGLPEGLHYRIALLSHEDNLALLKALKEIVKEKA